MSDYHQSLANTLKDIGAITFQVTDMVNEFTVFMCSRFFNNELLQGGSPHGRVYIALVRYGNLWHFKVPKDGAEPTHWSYFAEKMDIPDDIAKWVEPEINAVLMEYGKL